MFFDVRKNFLGGNVENGGKLGNNFFPAFVAVGTRPEINGATEFVGSNETALAIGNIAASGGERNDANSVFFGASAMFCASHDLQSGQAKGITAEEGCDC